MNDIEAEPVRWDFKPVPGIAAEACDEAERMTQALLDAGLPPETIEEIMPVAAEGEISWLFRDGGDRFFALGLAHARPDPGARWGWLCGMGAEPGAWVAREKASYAEAFEAVRVWASL